MTFESGKLSEKEQKNSGTWETFHEMGQAEQAASAKMGQAPQWEGASVMHGCFSAKLAEISGDSDFEAERSTFVKRFAQDEQSETLANQAFLASRRLSRLYICEEAMGAIQRKDAPLKFDLQRHADAVEADAQLTTTPWVSVTLLMSTSVGCRRLLERIEGLEVALATRTWTDEHRKIMLALCGRGVDTVDTELQSLSDLMIELQKNENDPHFEGIVTALRAYLDSGRRAFGLRLEQLEEDQEESMARALHVRASYVDRSPEGKAVPRAIGQATREYQSLMDRLEKIAKNGKSSVKITPMCASSSPPAPSQSKPVPTQVPLRNEPKWNLGGSDGCDDRATYVDVRIGDLSEQERRNRRPSPPSRKQKRR